MKSKVAWLVAVCLVITALVITSCGPTTTTTTTTSSTTTTTTTTTTSSSSPVTTTDTTTTPSTPTTTTGEPQYGGTIRFFNYEDVISWDPYDANFPSTFALSFMFEQLGMGDWAKGLGGTGEATYSAHGVIPWETCTTGCLAESWEWTDNLTLVFKIRQGVHFWDKEPVNGREMTAEDVAFCLNRYRSSPSAYLDVKDYIESIEATDEWTVVLKLNEFFAFTETNIIFSEACATYPRELIDMYGNLNDWRNICASGPFIVTSFVDDSIIEFEKNPTYWGYDELHPDNRLPYVDEVHILYIDDTSTRLAALRAGKLDAAWEVSLDQADILEQTNPELERQKMVSRISDCAIGMRLDLEPFTDINVRKALRMAIDFDSIVNDYYRGEAVLLNTPLRADLPESYLELDEYPEDVQEIFSYNPDKAKQLLEDAGYANLETSIITDQTAAQLVSVAVSYWSKIGINCTVETKDTSSVYQMNKKHSFPQMLAQNAKASAPEKKFDILLTGSRDNIGFSDPAYDAMYYELLSEFDSQKRIEIMQDMSTFLLSKAVNFIFPFPYIYQYWQPWLKGYHGELYMGTYGAGPIFARLWIEK